MQRRAFLKTCGAAMSAFAIGSLAVVAHSDTGDLLTSYDAESMRGPYCVRVDGVEVAAAKANCAEGWALIDCRMEDGAFMGTAAMLYGHVTIRKLASHAEHDQYDYDEEGQLLLRPRTRLLTIRNSSYRSRPQSITDRRKRQSGSLGKFLSALAAGNRLCG